MELESVKLIFVLPWKLRRVQFFWQNREGEDKSRHYLPVALATRPEEPLRFELGGFMPPIEIPTVNIFTRTPESKTKFLENCNIASGRLTVAQLVFTRFLSSISIAYGRAFDSHNALVKAINDIQTSGDKAADLILGQFLTLSLAFVSGGIGGVIGDTMKKAGEDVFIVDAIKDLAKFSIKGVGGAAIGVLADGGRNAQIDGMPQSPAEWQNSVNERITDELSLVAKSIDEWRTAVTKDDASFDAGFDPAVEVDECLVLKPSQGPPVPLANLPEVNKDQLQNQFEQGWLVAWLPKATFAGGKSFRFPNGSPNLRDNCRAVLSRYGQKIRLAGIDALVNQFCPRIEIMPVR
jgi:hypothetical protein